MIEQAHGETPRECCGLLAGHGDEVTVRYPLINAAEHPETRFESSPESMFAAVKAMRGRGEEVLAVYHSHPTTTAVPSATDREWNYAADVVNVIVSLAGAVAEVRGWVMEAEGCEEVSLLLGPMGGDPNREGFGNDSC